MRRAPLLLPAACLAVAACGLVVEPVKMSQEDWGGIMRDSSHLPEKLNKYMQPVLAQILSTVRLHDVGTGELERRSRPEDFTLDPDRHHRIITTQIAVVVSNSKPVVLQQGVGRLSGLAGYEARTNTTMDAKAEFVTEAQISMCKDLLGQCLTYLDQMVRVNVMFSGTIEISAALSLLEPRIEYFNNTHRVAFDFDASLTAENAKWDIVGITVDPETCQIKVGGVNVGSFCDRVESIFRDRDFMLKDKIRCFATEQMLSELKSHFLVVVGPTVAVPITHPSVIVY